MIQENQLEYSFQLHLKAHNNDTDISLVQSFFEVAHKHDETAQFLAWNNDVPQIQHPTVTHRKFIFQALRGRTKLKHYVGNFNRNRGTLYCRVKIRTKLSFGQLKDLVAPWLLENLHWIKEDYIQAIRVSNIGLLVGGTKAVDRDGTRATLENAIENELGRRVKLDLRLRKTSIKNQAGKTTMS